MEIGLTLLARAAWRESVTEEAAVQSEEGCPEVLHVTQAPTCNPWLQVISRDLRGNMQPVAELLGQPKW